MLTSTADEKSIGRLRPTPRPVSCSLAIALAATVALSLSACAALNEASKSATYSSNAKENYDKGLVELKAENWLEAIRYFTFTRAKFGFSKWATLSELGLADAQLGNAKYQEAVDGYRAFIKAHPTHEMVQNGYAAYKVGDAFYKQIPTDWFLVPPAYEKDQGPVRDALKELTVFVDEYRDSQYATPARKKIAECLKRLADHELYVATFYLKRNKPIAAVGRLEGLIRDYRGSSLEPEALLLLGRTYMTMDKIPEARRSFERLIATHAEDFHAKKAKLYLDHLTQRYPTVATAPPPDATPTPVATPPTPPSTPEAPPEEEAPPGKAQ
jgi:outer membrane protein assembly factor BamD